MTLSEGTGSILDATLNLALGVTGCHRTPLAQVLQILQRVLADEAELRVEHRSHVTGIEEETVATLPCGILGVVNEEFTVQGVDEVSTTHGTARVTGLSLFNHRGSKDTDIIRCHVHNFVVVHNE